MFNLKKIFFSLVTASLIIPNLLHSQEFAEENEPWWFFSLELLGIGLVAYLIIAIILKLPDENLSTQKETRKIFISNIMGFIVFGIALILRAYFEIKEISTFNSSIVFEVLIYISLFIFAYGISKYSNKDNNI